MKYQLLTAALALLVTQTAMAAAIPDPFPCPTVKALKSVGVSTTMWSPLGGPGEEWVGIERSNSYYTNVDWTFFISVRGLVNKPKNEVLAAANTAISSLILEGGPYPLNPPDDRFPESYYCEYISNDGSSQYAFTITPVVNLDKPLLVKLLKR